MAGEREDFRFDDLINAINNEGSYSSKLVGKGLLEIHRSGNYGTIFIPERKLLPAGRTLELAQISSFFPTGDLGLLEFVPKTSEEHESTLRRVLTQQIDAFDNDEINLEEHITSAVGALRQENLTVAGAFEIGKFRDGVRAVQIIYPLPYLKITHSAEAAATLAAAFVRAVAA